MSGDIDLGRKYGLLHPLMAVMVLPILGCSVEHQIPVGDCPELLTVRDAESGRYDRVFVVLPNEVAALAMEKASARWQS